MRRWDAKEDKFPVLPRLLCRMSTVKGSTIPSRPTATSNQVYDPSNGSEDIVKLVQIETREDSASSQTYRLPHSVPKSTLGPDSQTLP